MSVYYMSISQVDHRWQCGAVWQVVYIWGSGATDTGNDAWVTGRPHTDELYCHEVKLNENPEPQTAWSLPLRP